MSKGTAYAKATKTVIDNATPREKQFTIWCSDLKGFGVFVQPSGTRTYFVDYRNPHGMRRRMTIDEMVPSPWNRLASSPWPNLEASLKEKIRPEIERRAVGR